MSKKGDEEFWWFARTSARCMGIFALLYCGLFVALAAMLFGLTWFVELLK